MIKQSQGEEFPWTEESFDKFLEAFHLKREVEINWWWEPFHRTGFDALQFAARKNMATEELVRILDDLSCAAAPIALESQLRNLGALDSEGRIKSLDPQIRIGETWRLAGADFKKKFSRQAILPRIVDIRTSLQKKNLSFEPCFENSSEIKIVSKWLTLDRPLLNKFQQLCPWDKLELIESLNGGIISSSKLKFEHLSNG